MPPTHPRPKAVPPPEFPPRHARLFARTPPAVFPAILGLLGLALALRGGLAWAGLPPDAGALAAGLVLPLWAFAMLAYGVKLIRRPGVILEDLVVMPARGALGAACVGGMSVAALLDPVAPRLAWGVLITAMLAQTVLAGLLAYVLAHQPPQNRKINAGWHLVFSGYIVGGVAAVELGHPVMAEVLIWTMLPLAGVIWVFGLIHALNGSHPPPLRPIVAIHLAPASYFASVATGTGHDSLAIGFGIFALLVLTILILVGRKLTATGFSPLWAAFGFPLAACAGAMLTLGRSYGAIWGWIGAALLGTALIAVPIIAFRVLRLWATGRLAALTHTAEA